MSAPYNWAAGDDDHGDNAGSSSSTPRSSAWVIDTAPTPSRGGQKTKRRRRDATSSPELEQNASFTFDLQGDEQVAPPSKEPSPPSAPSNLLLPEHVELARHNADDPPDDAPSPSSSADGALGDFTLIDGADPHSTRYYDVAAAESRQALKECEVCGERGHTKRNCSHLLCASCGATDEHTTRDCPVGVSCFRCGMKGHRRNECTADVRRMPSRCRRCGASNHMEESCPTLWRIYSYVDEEVWEAYREGKATAAGTSSREHNWDPAQRWCYNCAARGAHWGDDCPQPRRSRHGEPSAFSEYVSRMGPFAHRLAPPPPSHAHPGADMYDVSVGSTASMHFLGGRAGGNNATLEEEVDRLFARAPGASRRQMERERARERKQQRRGATATSSSSHPSTRTSTKTAKKTPKNGLSTAHADDVASKKSKKQKSKGATDSANGVAGKSKKSAAHQGTGLAERLSDAPAPVGMDDYIVISSNDDSEDERHNGARANGKARGKKRSGEGGEAPPPPKQKNKKKARLSQESTHDDPPPAAAPSKKQKKAARKAAREAAQQDPAMTMNGYRFSSTSKRGGKKAKENKLRAVDAEKRANAPPQSESGSAPASANAAKRQAKKAKQRAQQEKQNQQQQQGQGQGQGQGSAAAQPAQNRAARRKALYGAANGATGSGNQPMFRGGYD